MTKLLVIACKGLSGGDVGFVESLRLGEISLCPQTPVDQDELPSWTSQISLSVGAWASF